MIPEQQIEETLTKTMKLLPVAIRMQLTHMEEPCPVRKPTKDLNIQKMAIWPKETVGFWDRDWCSFEIALGCCRGHPGHGWIGFFCFPNNTKCGGGLYGRTVPKILQAVAQLRPNEFEFGQSPKSYNPNRFYSLTKLPQFPCSQAAQDLAWLIQELVPRIRQMIKG